MMVTVAVILLAVAQVLVCWIVKVQQNRLDALKARVAILEDGRRS